MILSDQIFCIFVFALEEQARCQSKLSKKCDVYVLTFLMWETLYYAEMFLLMCKNLGTVSMNRIMEWKLYIIMWLFSKNSKVKKLP